jgi:signal transduction histidine kinase
MKRSVRQSLIAIALLGAITCVISSYALSRLVRTTTLQRIDRAHDLVAQQLAILRANDDAAARQGSAQAIAIPTMPGMRGGVLAPGSALEDLSPPLDDATRSLLQPVVAQASNGSDSPIVAQGTIDGTPVVVGARKTSRGAIAWMTDPVVPAKFLQAWQTIGATLTLAGLLLVIASIHLAVSVQRGASALKASLASLGRDLSAPVPRPALRELADVGDGIASLASELSRAQKEQARLAEELADQERLAALGRVAAGVAHEVRNPLASIKLRLDLARMEGNASPELVQELASASTEIARLDRFVADLLTVAGKRTGPRARADLGELASARARVVEPWAKERRVAIEVRGEAPAMVDADAVGRVIDNLLRNAVEASREDQVVVVQVGNGGKNARVMVKDHGPGVDEACVHQLFEPFFTTKTEGTGLGLALSRAIVTAHGGALTYRREKDTTVFELSLPDGTSPAAPERGLHQKVSSS